MTTYDAKSEYFVKRCKMGKKRVKGKRDGKYNARSVMFNGKRFASVREVKRWMILLVLERAGEIHHLKRQVWVPLHAPGGGTVGHYVADFVYATQEVEITDAHFRQSKRGVYHLLSIPPHTVIEDAKGVKTEMFKWKARHFKAEYGQDIVCS